MTIAEFCEAFAELAPTVPWERRRFYCKSATAIRQANVPGVSSCPVSFVATARFGIDPPLSSSDYSDAALRLGLAHDDAAIITEAADDPLTTTPEVRAALLAAAGLAPDEETSRP